MTAWGGCEDGGWYPRAAPKLSQVSAREAVDSTPVLPSLWVGAYPLVTLLLRLTLLAYPLSST